MTFCVETDDGVTADFAFDVETVAARVAEAVLRDQNCPYDACVNILLTDNAGIQEFNREYRGVDRETDVLSFPNLDFEEAGVFDVPREREADCFDPDSGELVLGDIMISVDRVRQQAKSYGHGEMREFAFLVAHSMFHLCGYDHVDEQDAKRMEEKQEGVLELLGITREAK